MLANQHRPRNKALKATDIYDPRPRGSAKASGGSGGDGENVVDIEEQRRRRREVIERYGPKAIPVGASRLKDKRKKKQEVPGALGRPDPTAE